MKRGLITVLDPSHLIVREGAEVQELKFSEKESPAFSQEWSAEIADENPLVKGVFPECVTVDVGWETWRFVGPVVLDSRKL